MNIGLDTFGPSIPMAAFALPSPGGEYIARRWSLVASLLLVAMPFAPSSILVPSSKARSP